MKSKITSRGRPKGVPHTVNAYIDYVRGGSYEELTGRKPSRGRNQ